jgi:hypothetical protein
LPHFPTGDYAFDVGIGREGETDEWIDFRHAAAAFSIVSTHISDGLANIVMDDVIVMPADTI